MSAAEGPSAGRPVIPKGWRLLPELTPFERGDKWFKHSTGKWLWCTLWKYSDRVHSLVTIRRIRPAKPAKRKSK